MAAVALVSVVVGRVLIVVVLVGRVESGAADAAEAERVASAVGCALGGAMAGRPATQLVRFQFFLLFTCASLMRGVWHIWWNQRLQPPSQPTISPV